ncbi:unnamed protein product [Durusdinium trenchii]|uniref:Uncharacterized protein n=1 Tax=Durusdinium trenchii TaxID=1381693 RepID=A0ABP0LRW5_9DINO
MWRCCCREVATETTGAAQIASLLADGRQLVEHHLWVLLYALAAPEAAGPAQPPSYQEMAAASWEQTRSKEGATDGSSPKTSDPSQKSQCHRLLAALLRQAHFDPSNEAELPDGEAPGGAGLADADVSCPKFPEMLEELRSSWQASAPKDSGLLEPFEDARASEARQAHLDLCGFLDKFCFFLAALRPYQRLASAGGDAALCWLRRGLGHLLQELDKSMVQMRQARLVLLRTAKRQLQDLAKGIADAKAQELRWMQDLRHIDELRLDELHQAVAARCTQVTSLTSAIREVELKAKAKEGLQQIAAAFLSPDFQARCSLALPERLASDMRELLPGRNEISGLVKSSGTLLVCDRKNRRNWLLSQSCRAGSLGKAERLDCALAGRTSFNRERQEVHLFRPVNACSSRVSSDQARVTGDDRLRCDR